MCAFWRNCVCSKNQFCHISQVCASCGRKRERCSCVADLPYASPPQGLHDGGGRLFVRFSRFGSTETEADGDGVIYFLHKYVVNMSHFFAQTRFVDGADLLEKNDGILHEPEAFCINVNMGGQLGFSQLAGDGGGDDSGAVFISHIILHDEHGAQSTLLTADNGAEIGVINISAFDGQFDHSFFLWFRKAYFLAFRSYFFHLPRAFNHRKRKTACQNMTSFEPKFAFLYYFMRLFSNCHSKKEAINRYEFCIG